VHSWEDPIPPLSYAIHNAFVRPFNDPSRCISFWGMKMAV
jgi:hypothetical protein